MFKLYRSVLAAGAVALGLAACGDNVTVTNPPTPTPLVHSVTVVPASQTVTVGQAGVTFVASVVADSGKASTVGLDVNQQHRRYGQSDHRLDLGTGPGPGDDRCDLDG